MLQKSPKSARAEKTNEETTKTPGNSWQGRSKNTTYKHKTTGDSCKRGGGDCHFEAKSLGVSGRKGEKAIKEKKSGKRHFESLVKCRVEKPGAI